MAIKFCITFFDMNNNQHRFYLWSDSSCEKEIIETFEQDYGTNYSKILDIKRA